MSQNEQIPVPVSLEEAEQITANIVGPMLKKTVFNILIKKGQIFENAKPGNVKVSANFTPTIKMLHLWSGAITALAMKIQCQTTLEYLQQKMSLDFDLINGMKKQIEIADDNINFISEELLKVGIKL